MASSSLRTLKNNINNLINQIITSDLHGRKIYLLGSAEYGPVNEPIRIKSTVGLYNKFGKTGTLIDAFHAVKYTSRDNEVYLVKTTGEYAIAYLNTNIYQGDISSNSFIIRSSEANEIFNDIYIRLDIDKLTVVYPDDLNVPQHEVTYDFNKYPNVELLSKAINKDTKEKRGFINATYTVDPSTPTRNAFYVCNPDIVYLFGGQCGLDYSKNLLYNCLQRTYDLLESFPIDIIVPVDAFIDDIYPYDAEDEQYQYDMKYYQSTRDYLTADIHNKPRSYMDQLINFCVNQLNFGQVTTGIMGFNTLQGWTTDILSDADIAKDRLIECFKYNQEICINRDYAFLVSVVAGDIKYNMGTIINNGYLAYAGFNASITINSGNTNIPVSDHIELYSEFSEDALKELADIGIVTFRHSPLYNKVVVYDGTTAYYNSDDKKYPALKEYCNVRMIQMCISYLNILFQYYIGLNLNELIDNKIIDTNITEILSVLTSRNIITDYRFKLEPDYKTGKLKVLLSLLTNYMTKAINIQSYININSEEQT